MELFCRILSLFVAVALALSCGRHDVSDNVLERIDAVSSENPGLAQSMLDSVSYDALCESDRHRYDLLSVKCRDKAYERHTGDSLILDVIEYYSRHRDSGHYPEALYYGGRVYSDLGDLPTAIGYFQDALNALPDDKEYDSLRLTVLNQMGRLHYSLRNYSEAISCLEKSIGFNDGVLNSDYVLAFTHSMIGMCHVALHDIKYARLHIDKALKHSNSLAEADKQSILIDFAKILYLEGKTDSALNVIRPLPDVVDELTLPNCLSLACEIYRDVKRLDTAYIYARRLTLLDEPDNIKTGYKVIFSESLSSYVPRDTLLSLIPYYKRAIEHYLDTHEEKGALMQNARYNYDMHVRERMRTEEKLHIYMYFTISLVIVILIIISVILYKKYKNAEKGTFYLEAKALTDKLKQETETKSEVIDVGGGYETAERKSSEIKNRILAEMPVLDGNTLSIDKNILDSEIYKALLEKAERKQGISDKDGSWIRLEEMIETVSPGFKSRLDILTNGRTTPNEYKVAMLIKCGFKPIKIATLLSRERNTVSSHRRSLVNKIKGQKSPSDSVDAIIILL